MRSIRALQTLGLSGLILLSAACGSSAPASSPASPPSSPGSATGSSAASSPAAPAKPAGSAAASAKPAGSAGASGAASGQGSAQPQASGQFSGGDPNGALIRISYASPAVSTTPYFAAFAENLYAQQHIKVTEIMMPPSVAITALSKGEIDMVDAPSNAIEGATRGLPFKLIYSAWQKSPWTLIGKAQYKSIQDLKGKIIGTNQAGSTPYIYLQKALQKAGMTTNDVKIVSSGGTIITYQGLVGGQVDAAVVSPPFDAQGDLAGFHEIQFLGDLLQIPYIGAGSSVPYLTAHHDETVRFLKAMIAANRWIKDHPTETADLITKYIGTPPDAAKISAQKMIPNLWQDTFEASPLGLQQALDTQAETTGEKINISPEQLVDYGPLHEALK